MRRCLHPFLQFSLTPLRQCKALSFGSLLISNTNTIAFFSSKSNGGAPHRLHFAYPYSRSSGGSRASRMSANESDSSSASSVVVIGCLVEHNGKTISSTGVQWTLPAGFMEIGESALEGATRETLEEACAEVEGLSPISSPFAQIDIPHIGQLYLIFQAKLKKLHYSPGPESLECRLFSPEDIPFDSLAFSSIIVTLRLYVEDIKAGNFKFHYCTLNKRPGASMTEPNGFDVDYLLPS